MKIEEARVHQSHCCVKHGCKYGDEDCPVVKGEVKQFYYCEACHLILNQESYYTYNDMVRLYTYMLGFTSEHRMPDIPYIDGYIMKNFLPELTADIEIIEDSHDEKNELVSMIDGAYEVVELFGYHAVSPSQKVWAKEWLEKAKKYGAKGD